MSQPGDLRGWVAPDIAGEATLPSLCVAGREEGLGELWWADGEFLFRLLRLCVIDCIRLCWWWWLSLLS